MPSSPKDTRMPVQRGPAMLGSEKERLLAVSMPHDRVLPETDFPFGQAQCKPLAPWDGERLFPVLSDQ